MGALAWTGLNILLLILVFYAWIKVFIVLRRQIGVGLAALFLLSLSVFRGSSSTNTEPPKNLIASKDRPTQFGNWSNHASVSLNPANRLFLLVEGKREKDFIQPNGLYVTVSGILLGHEWKPLDGIVNVGSRRLSYQVVLLHNWKLLGMTLYTTSEDYKGYISTTNEM